MRDIFILAAIKTYLLQNKNAEYLHKGMAQTSNSLSSVGMVCAVSLLSSPRFGIISLVFSMLCARSRYKRTQMRREAPFSIDISCQLIYN
jgi:hypothetical protein